MFRIKPAVSWKTFVSRVTRESVTTFYVHRFAAQARCKFIYGHLHAHSCSDFALPASPLLSGYVRHGAVCMSTFLCPWRVNNATHSWQKGKWQTGFEREVDIKFASMPDYIYCARLIKSRRILSYSPFSPGDFMTYLFFFFFFSIFWCVIWFVCQNN